MRSVHVPNQICKHMVYSPTVANKAEPNIRIQSRGDTCRAINLSCGGWAEAPVKIARMTLTIKLDGNWSSFQLANNTPPLSVTGSVIAPSARIISVHAFHWAGAHNQRAVPFPAATCSQFPLHGCLLHACMPAACQHCHMRSDGPLSRIAPQMSFHQRQAMSWPFVSWAMKPHHHGPELGKLCLRASSVITIEVILCKYSRR